MEAEAAPPYSIRWAAVMAGLAVGLGTQLLLLLLGAAAGFAVYGAGERPDGETVSAAALTWNGISMVIAALVGGLVAARSSGLRRNADGVLHALASWGASMLFFALLATSLAGSALSGAFGIAGAGMVRTDSPEATIGQLISGIERGDRSTAAQVLRERFGLSAEQAERVADRAMALANGSSTGQVEPGAEAGAGLSDAAQTASAASGILSLIIVLSLIAGAAGGALGARGNLNRSLPARISQRRVVRHHTREGIPIVS